MGVLRKRPLACFSLLFAAVGALYATGLLSVLLIPLLLLSGFCIYAAVLWQTASRSNGSIRHRGVPSRVRYAAFCAVAVLLGSLYFYTVDFVRYQPIRTWVQESNGQPVSVHATVTERGFSAVYASSYTVSLKMPGGQTVNAVLTCEKNADLQIGDVFEASLTVCSVRGSGEDERTIHTRLADGIYLQLQAGEDSPIALTARESYSWKTRFALFREETVAAIRQELPKTEETDLLCALLMGDKSGLDGQTELFFRRTGTSHLLALSGFHLSVLVLFLDFLLRLFGLPLSVRRCMEVCLAAGYVLLTGCAVSTMRAFFMLCTLFFTGLHGKKSDRFTSLCLFLAVCIAYRPEAIYDVGMWLSVMASFTIAEFAPSRMLRREAKGKSRIITFLQKRIYEPVLQSLGIMLFISLPLWLTEGNIAVLTPIATLLLSLPVAGILCGGAVYGLLSVLSGFFAPLAVSSNALGRLLLYPARWMLQLTEGFGCLEGTVVSTKAVGIAPFLAVLAVLLGVICIIQVKHPRRLLPLLAVWCVLFCLYNQSTYLSQKDNGYLTVAGEGNNDIVCFQKGNRAVLVDVTDGHRTSYYALVRGALPPEITEIEAVCLTHCHQNHVSALALLSEQMWVRSVWLPITDDAESAAILRSVAAYFADTQTQIVYYHPDRENSVSESVRIGGVYTQEVSRSTHPAILGRFSFGTAENVQEIVYFGTAFWESEGGEALLMASCRGAILLIGSHGPVNRYPSFVLSWRTSLSLLYAKEPSDRAAVQIDTKEEEGSQTEPKEVRTLYRYPLF